MVVKTGPSELSKLSDEDYLVTRAKQVRVSDPAAAKAWMITAKFFFPENFSIQFEAYTLEKEARRSAEAAKHLRELLERFTKAKNVDADPRLAAELKHLVDVLNDERSGSPEDNFLAEMFEHFPRDAQQRILLDSAFTAMASDQIAYAKRLLFAFKRFPELMAVHGSQFLTTAIGMSKAPNNAWSDPMHQLLVTEIFPKLLSESQLKVDTPILDDILWLTTNFACDYVSSVMTRSAQQSLADPFQSILTYVEEIGTRLGWSLVEDISQLAGTDAMWLRVSAATAGLRSRSMAGDAQQSEKQIFFVAMLLFLRSLSEYAHECRRGDVEESCVLVEAFLGHAVEATGAAAAATIKRRKTSEDERHFPLLTHGDATPGGESKSPLVCAFMAAYRYFDLITSTPALDSQLQALRHVMHPLAPFHADVALFQGRSREALQQLRLLPTPASAVGQCRHHLKMATVQYSLGDHNAMADHMIRVVDLVGSGAASASASAASAGDALSRVNALCQPSSSRHLHFLPFTRQNILTYAARIFVEVFKHREPLPGNQDKDLSLGHLIVLLQFIYPVERDLFYFLLNKIKTKESLSYPLFCTYVIHIEFLEEFALLLTDAKLVLDITPVVSNQRRLGTRGANKGEKEEIRNAIKKQVLRSHENLDDLLVDFLTKQRDSILHCLL